MGDQFLSDKEVKQQFKQRVISLQKKYPGQIFYHGVISGIAKRELLWISDIFVLPTFYKCEAFPISIIEALRAGNYIISTNHSFIPQIISSKNGDLIQPQSSDEIERALRRILKNQDMLRTIQNFNIKYAMEHFNERINISSIEELFVQTLT